MAVVSSSWTRLGVGFFDVVANYICFFDHIGYKDSNPKAVEDHHEPVGYGIRSTRNHTNEEKAKQQI